MTKAELLKKMQEGIRTEESATTVYLHHMEAIVSRSGLNEEKSTKLRKCINLLIDSNRRHKEILENAYAQIKGEACDVY